MKRFCLCTTWGLILATIAFADDYKLTFNGPTGKLNDNWQYYNLTINGVSEGSVYYGPYSMTVLNETTGGSPLLALVCIDGAVTFNNSVDYTIDTSTPITPQQLYLVGRLLTGNYSTVEDLILLNLALWRMVDPTRTFTSSYNSTTASSGADLIMAQGGTYSGDYTLYNLDIQNPQNASKTTQRFVLVPEPSLTILLGIGLLGVSLIALRRD